MNAPESQYHDPSLAVLYDGMNTARDDFDFCHLKAKNIGSVLDIGCGTGQLAAELSPGRRVVGLDPADAMLEVARNRTGGDAVSWVCGDARDFDLGQKFDLIVMTGHAYQALLTDEDQLAALQCLARHLAVNGRFLFDSRNPAIRVWERWMAKPAATKTVTVDGETTRYDCSHSFDAGTNVLSYTYHFSQSDGSVTDATSRLRFTPIETLNTLMEKAGLTAPEIYGDWSGAKWSRTSEEIIPYGTLA